MIHADQRTFEVAPPVKNSDLELHPLVLSGPSENRVDLTFFSDGYALHEKDKFLTDAKRLALDMSQNQTFSTVQPLMNFWAAFSPSQESGIGVAGVPKDTTYGLYRDGTELRAVYCSKRDVARDACLSLHSQCDYPILLGNDPLYGGLGGEFTISTASELNGPLVLRHELGHSIIGVGEEYDGGYAYFGVNAAENTVDIPAFKWSHWLSSSLSPGEAPREERAVMPYQAYPWTILNKTASWSGIFLSSGLYSRYLVRFSLSGLPAAEHLNVYLDGQNLDWKPRPNIGLDRWHYDIYQSLALPPGQHELNFTLGDTALEGTAQLCSAEIIEYGDETEFNSTHGYYGAFPTFSDQNVTTYRPTNEQCLMRVVTSTSFCSVCLEGLWLSLLKRVSLIDDFSVTLPVGHITLESPAVLQLTLVPFGELRKPNPGSPTEFYTIEWERDGVPLPQFSDLTRVVLTENVHGTWRATVQLHTAEVKVDIDRLLESRMEVQIGVGWDSPRFVAPDAARRQMN
ncbi:IgA peptidase M64-domain-containing protein [Gautieria morchelliformis]|nr:IgA peptidase M64-domain-containing protein [Gautieria morchelliformis]